MLLLLLLSILNIIVSIGVEASVIAVGSNSDTGCRCNDNVMIAAVDDVAIRRLEQLPPQSLIAIRRIAAGKVENGSGIGQISSDGVGNGRRKETRQFRRGEAPFGTAANAVIAGIDATAIIGAIGPIIATELLVTREALLDPRLDFHSWE